MICCKGDTVRDPVASSIQAHLDLCVALFYCFFQCCEDRPRFGFFDKVTSGPLHEKLPLAKWLDMTQRMRIYILSKYLI